MLHVMLSLLCWGAGICGWRTDQAQVRNRKSQKMRKRQELSKPTAQYVMSDHSVASSSAYGRRNTKAGTAKHQPCRG